MEYQVFWIRWRSFFELSGDGKYGFLLIQKVDVGWFFPQYKISCFFEYGKVLLLNFSDIGSTVFSLIWKVDGNLIFSWYFLTFHHILGLVKVLEYLKDMFLFCFPNTNDYDWNWTRTYNHLVPEQVLHYLVKPAS